MLIIIYLHLFIKVAEETFDIKTLSLPSQVARTKDFGSSYETDTADLLLPDEARNSLESLLTEVLSISKTPIMSESLTTVSLPR